MKTIHMTICALFAALTAILTQILIPIGPVPITLSTLSVLTAGALLGSKYGSISQLVYILLGVIGAPVFSGFEGGLGKIAGPTGGYIIGYFFAAWVVGFIIEKTDKQNKKLPFIIVALSAGYLTYTLLGTIWFMHQTSSTLPHAIQLCVLPFIPGDIAKIVLSTILTLRLRSYLQKQIRIRSATKSA